jgi:hypothetical protein
VTRDAGRLIVSAAIVRRVAIGLVIYGVVGLVLVVAAIVGGWSGIAQIDAAVGSAAEASETLESVGDAFAGFDASLETAGKSAEDAAAASRNASSTATRLADAMGLNIFGAQPLLPLANDFRRQATDLRVVADDLDALGGSLAKDRAEVKRIHDHVRVLSAKIRGFGNPAGGTGIAVLLVALLLWLGAQAVAALAVGIWLLRRRSHRRA